MRLPTRFKSYALVKDPTCHQRCNLNFEPRLNESFATRLSEIAKSANGQERTHAPQQNRAWVATGSLLGFAPLRMRSALIAARR